MLSGRIDMILDGGPTPGGLESTVVDLTGSTPRLLRPGLVTREEIEAVLGRPIQVGGTAVDETRPMQAPGMMARHYAPQVPLECVAGDGSTRVRALVEQGMRVGWLTLGASQLQDQLAEVLRISLPVEPAAYSAGLYAALHTLEDAGVERIVVATPPNDPAWLAVHDRLRRAGTPA
jgi:L-threonylcarbamoyladenylate synthase